MIRFTIVTITYNAAKVLGRTLESVLGQTYGNVEHLIIDGASTDGTPDLAKEYKQRNDEGEGGHQVIIKSEPDDGIYFAMNKALTQASGDYICYMNAGDSFPDNDTLEKITANCRLNSTPTDELPGVLYGKTVYTDNEGNYTGPHRFTPPERLTWTSFKDGMVVCHQAFYARCDIAKNLQFDTRYRLSADIDWCIRVMKETERMNLSLANAGIVVANYQKEGLSTQRHRASLAERYRIMAHHYGHVRTFAQHCRFVVRAIKKKISNNK